MFYILSPLITFAYSFGGRPGHYRYDFGVRQDEVLQQYLRNLLNRLASFRHFL